MVQQVTKGIKVTVRTQFEGSYFQDLKERYAFSYLVSIENCSEIEVQLTSRYWLIKDALNHTEVVEGPGVIGLQPIIPPGGRHQYSSGCVLVSPYGSMQGHYVMNVSDKELKVGIPLFKLHAPFAMN